MGGELPLCPLACDTEEKKKSVLYFYLKKKRKRGKGSYAKGVGRRISSAAEKLRGKVSATSGIGLLGEKLWNIGGEEE